MKTVSLQSATARWLHQQWQKRGVWAHLLWPVSCLALVYVFAKRRWYQQATKQVYRAPVPVVVVGNVYVGGVGKTPVVIALVQQLVSLGWTPGVISRGYGVKLGPAPRVGRGELDATSLGDEPALISEQTQAPVSVHPNRRLACQALLTAYPEVDIIVSDDGLQHLALARDLEILVQDERLSGNGWLLPAGPLREPASRLSTVDLVITRQATRPQHDAQQAPKQLSRPRSNLEFAPAQKTVESSDQPTSGRVCEIARIPPRQRPVGIQIATSAQLIRRRLFPWRIPPIGSLQRSGESIPAGRAGHRQAPHPAAADPLN